MRRITLHALALLLMIPAAPAARAALLVNEPFDYPATSLLPDFDAGEPKPATQPASLGGTGLSLQARKFANRTPVTIAQVGLAYTDSAGRALRTSGRSIIIPEGESTVFDFYTSGSDDPFARYRTPSDPREIGRVGETVWISFLVMTGAEPTAAHTFSLRFTGSGSSFPVGLVARGSSGAHTIGAISVAGKVAIEARKTYLVVLRSTLGADGEVEIWINPALGGERPAANPDLSLKKTNVSLRSLWFKKNTNGELPVAFDELRIGETYADVTPAP